MSCLRGKIELVVNTKISCLLSAPVEYVLLAETSSRPHPKPGVRSALHYGSLWFIPLDQWA